MDSETLKRIPNKGSVFQDWALSCSHMQQTVLMGIVRGPDDIPKYHAVKPVLRWYRRCLLRSALEGEVINNPWEDKGGSFTGSSIDPPTVQQMRLDGGYQYWMDGMDDRWNKFMKHMDAMPIHFWLHMMHAVEIMGYKHTDSNIREWWHGKYIRMVHAMHVWPETEDQLDSRLGDTREGWIRRSDEAIIK